jgi:hypothetical protein
MRMVGSLMAILALPTIAQAQPQYRSEAPGAAPTLRFGHGPTPKNRPQVMPRVAGRSPIVREPTSTSVREPTSTSNRRLASPPLHVERAVARHVRFHGRLLAVPAVVVIGIPVFLDVPDLGEVSIPEDDYPEIYGLLTSDDAADQEKAFALLQSIKNKVPIGSAEAASASQSTGPSGFRIVHPPVTTSSVAPDSAHGLEEPLSFDDPAPRRPARGLW